VRFRNRDHAAINALWVGVHFQDAALLTILVPTSPRSPGSVAPLWLRPSP
jgi:hypothetical protein